MTDVEVRLGDLSVGSIYRQPAKLGERIAFRYAEEWLSWAGRFAIDPELFLDRGTTVPARTPLFGAFADSAPDRWGRRLMQRRERHQRSASFGLERHGLEDRLRDILQSLEAHRQSNQREIRATVLKELLEGHPALTVQELE